MGHWWSKTYECNGKVFYLHLNPHKDPRVWEWGIYSNGKFILYGFGATDHDCIDAIRKEFGNDKSN